MLVLAACGGSKSTQARQVVSTCGSAYSLEAPTAKVSTNCGGTVGFPPRRVTLGTRVQFVIQQTPESTGKLDFPTLVPRGGAVRLISASGASARYVTVRAGKAALIAHSLYCERPVRGSCAAFIVAVR